MLAECVQVRYITRFTEESFAALISIIFVVESFMQLYHTTGQSPPKLHTIYSHGLDASLANLPGCACFLNGTHNSLESNWTTTSTWFSDMSNATSNLSSPWPVPHLQHDESHGAFMSTLAVLSSSAHSVVGGHVAAHNLAHDVEARLTACKHAGGVLLGSACEHVPDVFFFCVILFILTFLISMALRSLRESPFLPNKARRACFAPTVIAYSFALRTLTCCIGHVRRTVARADRRLLGDHRDRRVLRARHTGGDRHAEADGALRSEGARLVSPFAPATCEYNCCECAQPTRSDESKYERTRGWVINPFAAGTPVWIIAVSIVPAIFAVVRASPACTVCARAMFVHSTRKCALSAQILIFMDQQITAVIVNRKDNKLTARVS